MRGVVRVVMENQPVQPILTAPPVWRMLFDFRLSYFLLVALHHCRPRLWVSLIRSASTVNLIVERLFFMFGLPPSGLLFSSRSASLRGVEIPSDDQPPMRAKVLSVFCGGPRCHDHIRRESPSDQSVFEMPGMMPNKALDLTQIGRSSFRQVSVETSVVQIWWSFCARFSFFIRQLDFKSMRTAAAPSVFDWSFCMCDLSFTVLVGAYA
jgi:hypothetical protein